MFKKARRIFMDVLYVLVAVTAMVFGVLFVLLAKDALLTMFGAALIVGSVVALTID